MIKVPLLVLGGDKGPTNVAIANLLLSGHFVWFDGDEDGRKEGAFRNSSLQGAYLMIAARALGLDCGPMSGFDSEAVDKAFFADQPRHRSNFICAIGYGDRESIFARSPRPDFDKFNRID